MENKHYIPPIEAILELHNERQSKEEYTKKESFPEGVEGFTRFFDASLNARAADMREEQRQIELRQLKGQREYLNYVTNFINLPPEQIQEHADKIARNKS